jgi:hypothetical protein
VIVISSKSCISCSFLVVQKQSPTLYIYILITFILCMCAFLCVCKETSSNLQYFTYACKQIDSNLYYNFLAKFMLLKNQAHIIFTSMLKACHHVTWFNLFHDFFLGCQKRGNRHGWAVYRWVQYYFYQFFLAEKVAIIHRKM